MSRPRCRTQCEYRANKYGRTTCRECLNQPPRSNRRLQWMTDQQVVDWFWQNKRIVGECWEWAGSLKNVGYGQFNYKGSIVTVHRFAFKLVHGDVPAGHYVCHRCDNKKCYRPEHLFAGTPKHNVYDMHSKGRAFTKLTLTQVVEIRRLYIPRHSEFGGMALARKFGTSITNINHIIKRRTWNPKEMDMSA